MSDMLLSLFLELFSAVFNFTPWKLGNCISRIYYHKIRAYDPTPESNEKSYSAIIDTEFNQILVTINIHLTVVKLFFVKVTPLLSGFR